MVYVHVQCLNSLNIRVLPTLQTAMPLISAKHTVTIIHESNCLVTTVQKDIITKVSGSVQPLDRLTDYSSK